MRAILPLDVVTPDQAEVSLVDEGGGLEGLTWLRLPHVSLGQAVQFGVDERKQLVLGGMISVSPGHEQFGYIGRTVSRCHRSG